MEELELGRPAMYLDRYARVGLVPRAFRHFDPYGWTVVVTGDDARLRLGGSSVSIDLGLSAAITSCVQDGVGSPRIRADPAEALRSSPGASRFRWLAKPLLPSTNAVGL